jgi:hypothetical protein
MLEENSRKQQDGPWEKVMGRLETEISAGQVRELTILSKISHIEVHGQPSLDHESHEFRG